MKLSVWMNLLAVALVIAVGGMGCKHKPKGLTPISGASKGAVTGPGTGPIATPAQPISMDTPTIKPVDLAKGPEGQTALAGLEDFENYNANRDVFKQYTVYFDFDRSTVKDAERTKIEAVANFLKSAPADNKLLIEGHCDERGTEEYNRALGERRALALREYLTNLGVGAEKIRTISYGEDRPAVPGNDESAWSKNRRGEFLLLTPKQ